MFPSTADPFDGDVTRDDFLGGKVKILQPRVGYRAGVDPVYLAASVPAQQGQQVLELGCGVGTASLCLGWRIPDLKLFGLEIQAPYAELARRNGQANGQNFSVFDGDLTQMPTELLQMQFDHVIANPPFYDRGTGTPATDEGRETALGEGAPLKVWISAAARRLRYRGMLTVIQKADRLGDVLSAMQEPKLGSIQVLPLLPRTGRDAELVLIRAVKEGRARLRLHAPVILHDGARHIRDGVNDATAEILAVQREGAALNFPA